MKRWKDCKVRRRNLRQGVYMAYFLIKSDVSKCPFAVWQHCSEPKAFMGSRIGSFLEKGYFRDIVLKVAPWLCAH